VRRRAHCIATLDASVQPGEGKLCALANRHRSPRSLLAAA
jgi:hypothetical protein